MVSYISIFFKNVSWSVVSNALLKSMKMHIVHLFSLKSCNIWLISCITACFFEIWKNSCLHWKTKSMLDLIKNITNAKSNNRFLEKVGIDDACLGPISVKNLLNPLSIFRSCHPKVFSGKDVLKICSKFYRRTSMPNCDFNKVVLQRLLKSHFDLNVLL